MKSSGKAILATAALITLLFAPVAQANTLVATSPIAGSTLKAGPSAITITTEFPLIEEGNEIIVTDPNGKRVDTGILTVLGTDAVAEMKPLETSGLYKVSYLLLAEAEIPLEGHIHLHIQPWCFQHQRQVRFRNLQRRQQRNQLEVILEPTSL